MEIYRAYKLCIKPTEAQVAEIENTFRCCRFVWNHFLERKSKAYRRRGESLSYYGMKKLLTERRDWTLSDENINMDVRTYADGAGKLHVVLPIGSIAGADSYEQVLDLDMVG